MTVTFATINDELKKASIEHGAFATDPQGETHYMGVYEKEHDYIKFRTLGAKRYVFTQQNKKGVEQLGITIAGVSKDGWRELEQMGGIDAFKEGIIFHDGQVAFYNDKSDYGWFEINGESVHICRNVALTDKTYELGIGGDYSRIIKYFSVLGEESIDNWEEMVYNFNCGRSATAHTKQKKKEGLEP